MFHRNSGRFRHKITLLRPSAPVRDELGGISATTYEAALTLFAMVEQKSQTRQQFIGDYVTSDTRYFVVRDIRSLCPGIDTSWRLTYGGYTYLINELPLFDESIPYFIQITVTAINGGRKII
jgi:hypothetical protein